MEPTLVKSSDKSIIVHAWSHDQASDNPEDRIPKSYVKKQSKSFRLGYDSQKGWHRIFVGEAEGKAGIQVTGDLLAEDLRAAALYAREFEAMIRRKVDGPESNRPYVIRIFRDPSEFRTFAAKAGAANAESYYDPRTYEMVLWFDGTVTHPHLQELMAHEFTHAYMDLIWNCRSPLWFAEGMAEYFQNFEWMGDHAEGGGENEKQLEVLARGDLISLEQFVQTPREEMYGPLFAGLYAQAWSVVHFLFEHDPDVIVELLERKPIDVAGLNEQWLEHVESL